ncbi:MAG: sugar phosphate isomerase/epimerase family protein [Planctomycetota bacterium]|nr:sugar phosphate isomerase/epimerase family protein [Planctomycetota bacterium]
MARNVFSMNLNSYGWGSFDVAECLGQIKQTPIRLLELPAEQRRPNSLIPELMVDESMDGRWQFSLTDLKTLLAEDGFGVESLNVFGELYYPKGAKIIERRIDFARDLGASVIVLGCGHKLDEQTRCFTYRMLKELGERAGSMGIKIALEVHPGVAANAAEALRTMKEVNCENVGINFDTANIIYGNPDCDPAEELSAMAEHVFHVHLKDIKPGRTRAEHILPPLGEGMVDFPRVFDILHGVGFTCPFSFEIESFHGMTKSQDIRDYQKYVLASIEYISFIGQM